VTYYLQILLAISVLIHNLKKLYGIVWILNSPKGPCVSQCVSFRR
jgi:hypothetical protein